MLIETATLNIQEPQILVVDDHPQNVRLLAMMLESKGFQIQTATSGEEALNKVDKAIPSLILLDILMPGMSGFDVCKQLKTTARTKDIPVIFISALIDKKDRLKGFDVGGVDYITKPFDISEVVARVRIHLTLRQNQLEIAKLHKQAETHISNLKQEIEQRKATEESLYHVVSRLTMLNRLISSTKMDLSTRQVMNIISENLYHAFKADRVVMLLVHSDQRLATIEASTPASLVDSLATLNVLLVDKSLYQQLLESPSPLVVNDIGSSSLSASTEKEAFLEGIQSFLAVSMFTHDKTIGIFFICYDEQHEFTQDEVLFGREVSQTATQTLENNLLHQHLASHNEQLGRIVARRTDQLNRLNKRLSAILGSITDGIILLYENGTFDLTNQGFDTLFGYYPDELFGQPIHRIVIPEYHDLIDTALENARRGDSQKDVLVEANRKNGKVLDVHLSFSLVEDEEKYILCNCHDVTYLKEMERIKDNFISMVTHELRTPVTNIMLTSKQLNRYFDRMKPEQIVRKVQQLEEQSDVLAELVESVLDISRLEMHTQEPRRVEVDVIEIVKNVISEVTIAAEEKQQFLNFIYDEPSQQMQGDTVDFSRIWRNLISNAIKYTQNEGRITARFGSMRINKHGEDPILSSALISTSFCHDTEITRGIYHVGQVEDDGHGISPEDQENLFKRFHRGWAKQSSIPGTGLGLALVKELLDLYSGDIHVDSTLNKGTIFTFWFPTVENNHDATSQ